MTKQLNGIYDSSRNIIQWERDISSLSEDINTLLRQKSRLQVIGDKEYILSQLIDHTPIQIFSTNYEDISALNWPAFQSPVTQDEIVIDIDEVHQAKTGSIVILKGAHYNRGKSPPVVHRSPPIKHLNETRLLLRIDSKRKALIR